MLNPEAINTYINDFNDSKKRKVKNVLTLFMEYQVRNGLDSVTEADVKTFMAENNGKWKQAVTYENYIREYFGLPKTSQSETRTEGRSNILPMEETTTLQSEEVTECEPVEEKSKRRGIRRVQVSVYLNSETYDVLYTLSRVTHDSVNDMLSKAGDELAKKNYNTAEQVRERLQGFKVEY